MKSTGMRFLSVAVLAIAMFVPLFFAGELINARSNYNRATISSVGAEWGGPQLVSGPQIVIPVKGPVSRTEKREIYVAGKTEPQFEDVEITEVQYKTPIHLFPEDFKLALSSATQERARGIFQVPVYTADVDITAQFEFSEVVAQIRPEETILWSEAELRVSLDTNRALRGAAELRMDGVAVAMEPLTNQGSAGISAALGDPRDVSQITLKLGFNGSEQFMVTPVGRVSEITMTSDWPHPSFTGAFLPNSIEVRDDGFDAQWLIPHLARPLPQVSRGDFDPLARAQTAFGVRYFQPNDFYQKAYRAARYGILFIALTFLTVLLIEDRGTRPTHPVQYIFIGLAQSIFVLLMVAYSEQIGFGPAYAVSAGATIALITMFGFTGLRLGLRALVLGAILVLLYGVLYLILRSADYALLTGATVAFAALAGTMYVTRNEDWYGTSGSGATGWWARKSRPVTPPAG